MRTLLLTDSGLETWLVFHRGVDLPDFAAFPLLDAAAGRSLLREYFVDHLRVASSAGTGIVLETPTWRANRVWGARLGYDAESLDRVNRDAVQFLRELVPGFPDVAVTISGNIGPRGDGYSAAESWTPDEAAEYHRPQLESFSAAGVDRVTMLTATHAGEAIGVVRAAGDVRLPVVIAFTVETDGHLPDGQPLHEAVAEVDDATDASATYFGVNCAHPDHFAGALRADPAVTPRIRLIRANASRASHEELDAAEELDDGDPEELAALYDALRRSHPDLEVVGGCCGTDVRHIEAIARACGSR